MIGSLVKLNLNTSAVEHWLIVLGYLFRATSGGIMRVAGLAAVEGIPGLENIDVTTLVNGHMAYRAAMPRLLREVGWEVESDEFTEIEDPDPENHERRQRELIRELDEARKDAETRPEKRRFGFFKRGKLAEKKRWETYDERTRAGGDSDATGADGGPGYVLFDIEAIKAELASEQIEVKQLESTLPPMQLNLEGANSSTDRYLHNPRSSLRETKSFDVSMAFRPKVESDSSQISLPMSGPANPFDQGYDDDSGHREGIKRPGNTENIKLSFDTNTPRTPSPTCPSQSAGLTFPTHDSSIASYPPSTERYASRPPTTLPTGLEHVSLEHNAWLDDEEEDFGAEKQVTMSFA